MDAIQLLFRLIKGTPLTDLELDDNFRKLKTAVNFLLAANESSSSSSYVKGEVKMFAGTDLPTGYLWCNGAAVSRTTYASLFAITGVKFGVGNGTTTFNLPDFRGAVPMGANPMGGLTKVGISTRTDGAIVGAETANANHDHTASGTFTGSGASYTPSGEITVNNYDGAVTPDITTTIEPTALSTTPSGSIDSDTTLSAASPTINVLGEACVSIHSSGEPTNEVMDCVDLTVSTIDVIAALNPVTTSDFTGSSDDLTHSHSASSTSGAISLTHGHTATFTGESVTLEAEGAVEIDVNEKALPVSTIQPSQVCNFIIKY